MGVLEKESANNLQALQAFGFCQAENLHAKPTAPQGVNKLCRLCRLFLNVCARLVVIGTAKLMTSLALDWVEEIAKSLQTLRQLIGRIHSGGRSMPGRRL
jgi:hypothetical protein